MKNLFLKRLIPILFFGFAGFGFAGAQNAEQTGDPSSVGNNDNIGIAVKAPAPQVAEEFWITINGTDEAFTETLKSSHGTVNGMTLHYAFDPIDQSTVAKIIPAGDTKPTTSDLSNILNTLKRVQKGSN